MKMIISKTKNENYLAYLILEVIMVSVITFLGIGLAVFYIVGKSDSRSESKNLEYLFDNPFIFGLICILPALLAVVALLYFRNRNYIIGYLFDDSSKQLLLEYRGIMNKIAINISIPYSEINTINFSEKKILFNQIYKGKRILIKRLNLKIDFVANNFIWEKQPREKKHFLEQLNQINN